MSQQDSVSSPVGGLHQGLVCMKWSSHVEKIFQNTDHKEIKEEKKEENSNQHLIETKRSLNQSGLEYMKRLKSCMKEKNPAPTPERDSE